MTRFVSNSSNSSRTIKLTAQMKKQISSKYLFALAISLSLLACKPSAKQDESAGKSDTAVAEVPQPPSMDAAMVAPDLYKVAKDTMGIRVLEVTYKPGDSSALHNHPDYVLYVIDGGKAQMTAKDGSMKMNELKSGMIAINGAGTHSVKNTGTTTMRAILVEV